MRGTKRAAVSDTFPATTNDAPFHHKKIVGGSLFGTQSVEPPQQHSQTTTTTTTTLDKQRAESARKNVRALNNQFASWVQMQLKNHPDELWEDGLRDYLTHASSILEKFSDVVNWLKANSGKGEKLSSESHGTEKKLVAEFKNNDVKLFPDKNSFVTNISTTGAASASNSQTGLFSNSQSGFFSGSQSGLFSNSQPGVFSSSQFGLNANSQSGLFGSGQFGLTTSTQPSLFPSSQSGVVSNSQPSFSFSNNQSLAMPGVSLVSITAKRDGLEDADEDEPPQPSSPSVKKAEEKGIVVVHQVKCKLYVKSNDPADKDTWKDKGTGNLCIKCKEGVDKGAKESKPTIIVRNDVGKLLLNALLYHGIKTNAQKNSLVAIFHTSEDDSNESVTPRTFLIRTKTAEDRDKLAIAIEEYAPSS
ncbi:PREDICTED: uncharacterized protein LOC104806368 isoform X2 [Tarenaya hassleriana]|uniref:uncharacterized protein LOC104806368 isoform X2 n=1 Tax=Tarenaya hassleriana TaxID=28532 RepID=UPI00053C2719|nr:PREDICTED: uncharacterized protein LOC104806368 isoform X2 [Tarenaya hassleriana]